jgi:fumarate reductase flavoprotein subunit
MDRIAPAAGIAFDATCDVLVVGAGACGLVAGLRAAAAGADALVLERDRSPSGSTAMSSGFIPAPGTRFQRALGIDDNPALLAADIDAKAKGRAGPPEVVGAVTSAIGPALEWLADSHGLDWIVLDDFLYPGHSRLRMHAVPEKTGAALMARLLAAAGRAGLPVVTGATVTTLFAEPDGRIAGVALARPDGAVERIGCRALVLACNGYGGNPELVRSHIPEMADALYHGHAGNQGDAVLWGEALGAGLGHMGAYQGHGSLAHPHAILITWALMMEGALQVNAEGRRFSNEHGGYSEQAVAVLAQPGGVAWTLYDDRLHRLGLTFPDYVEADRAGAVLRGETVDAIARATGLPPPALAQTLAAVEACRTGAAADPFGRDFTTKPGLGAPYRAVRVTGALFHTQGGLVIDAGARVLRPDGSAFPNLFAAGGAACGVSGPAVWGYLSGNGLLSAVGFGFIAGERAAGC